MEDTGGAAPVAVEQAEEKVGRHVAELEAVGECLWSVKQAAAYLHKSERWVWSALRLPPTESGSVPHIRLGRTPRFDPAMLRQWIAWGTPPAETFRQWRERQTKKSY